MNKNARVTLITHTDLDGVGCAVLVERAFKGRIDDIIYANYHNIDFHVDHFINTAGEDRDQPKFLIISDICPKKELVDQLTAEVGEGVFEAVLMDHHKTTNWVLKYNEEWLLHDESQCGTLMMHNWLNFHGFVDDPNNSERFAKTVDAYDRWVLDSDLRPRSERVNRLVWFLGFDRFVEVFSQNWHAEDEPRHHYVEQCLLDKEERVVTTSIDENLVDENMFKDRDGRRFALFVATGYASQVGNAILEDDESIDYIVMINPGGNKLEFRSRKGGVDVSEIAKRLGGGGHQAAAGCQLPFTRILQVCVAGLF